MEVKWGSYLITGLATFVGLVGSAVWTLVAFAVHQLRAKPGSHDAVYFQHQIVFRNDTSAPHAIFHLVKICFFWRGKQVRHLKRRSCFAVLSPVLVFAGFTLAGLFVGQVAIPDYLSNNVKVGNSTCGFVDFNETSEAGLRGFDIKQVNATFNTRAYAKNCYELNSQVADCSLYPVPRLPYTSSFAHCPFGNDPSGEVLCIPGAEGALQLDTGLLDTCGYLGINVAKKDRVLFRKRVTCSPIRVHDYVVVVQPQTTDMPILQYNMGYVVGDPANSNFTYSYNAYAGIDNIGYQIT